MPFLIFIFLFIQVSFVNAQKLNTRSGTVVRPMIFLDYSIFHYYYDQKVDFAEQYGGQFMNVLPGIGSGFIIGDKNKLLTTFEWTFKYFPFSNELVHKNEFGAIAIPMLVNFRIPMFHLFYLNVGAGVQWSMLGVHSSQPKQITDFFHTYIGELGIGYEENAFIFYFMRFGYSEQQSLTIDTGFRFGLNTSLWD